MSDAAGKDAAGAARAASAERARLISYLVLFAGSAVLFVEAGTLKASRWEVLGAGAFPRVVFGLLCLLSGAAAIQSVAASGLGGWGVFAREAARWARRRRLALALLPIFGLYLGAMPFVGYAVATFAFLLAAIALLAPWTPRAAITALAIAAAFSYGLDALFREVFDVFLPRWRL